MESRKEVVYGLAAIEISTLHCQGILLVESQDCVEAHFTTQVLGSAKEHLNCQLTQMLPN